MYISSESNKWVRRRYPVWKSATYKWHASFRFGETWPTKTPACFSLGASSNRSSLVTRLVIAIVFMGAGGEVFWRNIAHHMHFSCTKKLGWGVGGGVGNCRRNPFPIRYYAVSENLRCIGCNTHSNNIHLQIISDFIIENTVWCCGQDAAVHSKQFHGWTTDHKSYYTHFDRQEETTKHHLLDNSAVNDVLGRTCYHQTPLPPTYCTLSQRPTPHPRPGKGYQPSRGWGRGCWMRVLSHWADSAVMKTSPGRPENWLAKGALVKLRP